MTCRTVHYHLQQQLRLALELEPEAQEALEPERQAQERQEPAAGRRVRADRKRAGPLRMRERLEPRTPVGPVVLAHSCREQEVLRKLVAPLVPPARRRRRAEHQIRW